MRPKAQQLLSRHKQNGSKPSHDAQVTESTLPQDARSKERDDLSNQFGKKEGRSKEAAAQSRKERECFEQQITCLHAKL